MLTYEETYLVINTKVNVQFSNLYHLAAYKEKSNAKSGLCQYEFYGFIEP